MERPTCIEENVLLAPLTTLGVGGAARYLAHVTDVNTLREVLAWAKSAEIRTVVIGGGSNVLVSDQGFDGLVLHMGIVGTTYRDSGECIQVRGGAGVALDDLIRETVERGLWGLENLSAIPGTVGAVPIQNVGAYGVEVKDVIDSVTVYDSVSGDVCLLTNRDCEFGYRDSIFKHGRGEHLIVTEVTFRLSQNPSPKIKYKDLREHFGEIAPSLKEVRNEIIKIRSKKFPDWQVLGTAGSFFKNPIVTHEAFHNLQKEYPELPGYEQHDGRVKLSLGWVLDHVCGLKGYWHGDVGLFEHQALVLVCKKGTSSRTVEEFSTYVIDEVYKKINVRIEREVVVLSH